MPRSKSVIFLVILATMFFSSAIVAKELSGKYTPEQIQSACKKVGGEYFPQGQTGTYGCENHKNGKMVLCNRDGKCTGYKQTRTAKENRRIIRDLKLNLSATVKE